MTFVCNQNGERHLMFKSTEDLRIHQATNLKLRAAWAAPHMYRNTGTCEYMHRSTGACEYMHRSTGTCEYMHRSTGPCEYMPGAAASAAQLSATHHRSTVRASDQITLLSETHKHSHRTQKREHKSAFQQLEG